MSCLLVLVNRLKAEANQAMLTDTQGSAYTAVMEYWRFPRRINLYGPPGSGRTFLAWVISKSEETPYYVSIEELRSATHNVSKAIIDNVSATEREVRDLLAKLQLRRTHTALVITDRPVNLGLAEVELSAPTSNDFDVVYHNLSLLEYYALEPVRQGNLWEALHAACR